ncbi:hypothetical protein CTI12_AA189300 [Artemisia annua]|uniref:Uncharacterized protein n=1 Tax=Artemisia annua TaxID=35608 RepID=A0A2U1P698_ARTAN|nr:hypothetical protein CTI12_AA189300 [Artemisia annua]
MKVREVPFEIFSWMQSKLNGKQVTKKPNTVAANNHMGQATSKEEFSDWPQSLLAIGTFGISNLRADPETESEEAVCEDLVLNKDARLRRSISGMFSRGKEILVDHKKNVIRKKSLSFFLKKMFTSRDRLNHVLPDPTFDKSRMEKILRSILNKKIHPQSATAKPMPNKYLTGKDVPMDDQSDDEDDSERSTWVKTDSEYIVLEI